MSKSAAYSTTDRLVWERARVFEQFALLIRNKIIFATDLCVCVLFIDYIAELKKSQQEIQQRLTVWSVTLARGDRTQTQERQTNSHGTKITKFDFRSSSIDQGESVSS